MLSATPFGRMHCYRITSVPRSEESSRSPSHPGPRDSERIRARLFAALTATHASLAGERAAQLALAWWRPDGEDVRVVLGATPSFPLVDDAPTEPDDDGCGLLYPPGARARQIDVDEADRELGKFPSWVACGGAGDALWTIDGRGTADPLRGGFEDHAAHLPHPFVWLVLAEPVSADALEREIVALESLFPALRMKTNSEKDRVALQRAEGRYRDLVRARVTGLWSVRIAAGGRNPAEARANAAVLASASELDEQPFVVVPDTEVTDLHSCLGASTRLRGEATVPFTCGADILLATAPPPTREIPGVRAVDAPEFDVTAEATSGPEWALGAVLDRARRAAGPFTVSRDSLNRHAFICGATGSGKSQTMRTVLEEIANDPVDPLPWLVVEPAKGEYARMAGRLGPDRVTVIRPGDPDVAPACLNPLEPEPGFPLQAHADLVRALFLAAFEVSDPFPQVLGRALTDVYVDAGWDLLTGTPRPTHSPTVRRSDPPRQAHPRYPRLGDLQRAARRVVTRIGYGDEVAANVQGFVDVRIGSLRSGTPGRFFDGGHPLDLATLLDRHVVLELDGVTNDQDKAFLMGVILIRLVEHLRVRGSSPRLRHLLVIEEAHRLLKNVADGPAAGAVELFASLVAEIRAYGEGVAVVEQIPSKILPDVLKNTAVKIVHRLPAADDRAAVGATINLSEQASSLVVSLPRGRAAAATDGMDYPVLVQFPLREGRETSEGARSDAPLAGRRSPWCPGTCHEAPCSAREINDAEHDSRSPVLVLWCETIVMSLLQGVPVPTPSERVARALADVPQERIGCMLIHLAERAVAARQVELRPWVDVADLEGRVLDEMTSWCLGEPPPEDPDPLHWTAGPCRYSGVRESLAALPAETAVDPDPRWSDLKLHLDAPTAGGCLAQLDAEPVFRVGGDRVVVGDTGSSLLRESVEQVGAGADARAMELAIRSVTRADAPGLARLLHLSCHLLEEN
ncbi:ATP-binding protein [Actinomycetospora atypica]|uniref:ATP-binding protein n=1 Tax=Actinomycetospora atypica TaxID=1290095 RepID=A0ABV9YG10_9PSEU